LGTSQKEKTVIAQRDLKSAAGRRITFRTTPLMKKRGEDEENLEWSEVVFVGAQGGTSGQTVGDLTKGQGTMKC